LGLARTVLALGTLGTLLATSPRVLMSPLATGARPPICTGVHGAGIWCLVPTGHGELARWLGVAILAVTATGWRPRFTAIPHWYVAWSLMVNVTVQDGGDQITAVLTLLLIPVALADPRRWHWQPAPAGRAAGLGRVGAYAGLLLIQLQVAGLYLQASVAKLGVREWADGTAMFYWFRHPVFGAPSWLRPLTDAVSDSPAALAMLTWSSIGLEFALAIAIVMRRPAKRVLLLAGLLFHDMIALTMGLVSFDAAMSGALLLYLLPIGHQVQVPDRIRRWARSFRDAVRHRRSVSAEEWKWVLPVRCEEGRPHPS
jgi:antimicrobial peptide system SdpB family protein